MTGFQIAFNEAFDQRFGPLQQPNPSPPTPPPTQPNLLAKKKRNQKTRDQYKRKAQAQAQRVPVQEVEHLDIQISVEKVPSRHVVLKAVTPWETSWHAVISYVGMTLFGMIMIGFEAVRMRRMGVG